MAWVDRGTEYSYGELWRDILGTQSLLENEGIRAGDWVAFSVSHQYLHLLASLALLRMGCSQIGFPSHESPHGIRELSSRLHLRWIVSQGRADGFPGDREVDLPSLSAIRALPCTSSAEAPDAPDACFVFTSSGTTGTPKVIAVSQRKLLFGFASSTGDPPVFHQRVSIDYHIGKAYAFRCLFAGGTFVTSDNGEARDLPDLCDRYNVTSIRLSVYAATQLVGMAEQTNVEEPALQGVAIELAGSKVGLGLLERVRRRLGSQVAIPYGTTEARLVSRATGRDLLVDADSVGYPVPGVAVRIVDEAWNPVPAGVRGLIGIRSEACVDRYLLDDELSARHFRLGWFYPGDVGTLTEDGMLLLHGRADEMMIMNSINIFPAEIEAVAATYPGVEDCAAFPIASEMHGAIPALAVTSKVALDAKDVLAFCRRSLGIRSPRKVVQVDGIPRNSQGKILRRQLAESTTLTRS